MNRRAAIGLGLLLAGGCTPREDPPPSSESILKTAAQTSGTGSLVLSQVGLTDELLAEVLADPRTPALRSVTLQGNRLTAGAVEILETSDDLRGVEWLNLSGNRLGTAGVDRLARSPLMKTVQRLFISDNGADASALAGLEGSAPALIYLAAGDQPLGDDGARTLAGLGRLTRLEVPRAGIGGVGARALLEGSRAKVLVLEGNPVGPGGLTGLTRISETVEALTLDDCQLGPADIQALAAIEPPAGLKLLELSGNPDLGDEGIRALSEVPWLRSLEKLVVMESGAALEHRQAVVDAWGVRSGIKIERR